MKKNIKIGLLSILGLIVIYFGTFYMQNYLLKKNLYKNYIFQYNTEDLVKYDFERCNLNIFYPEISFIELEKSEYIGDDFGVYFYKPKNFFFQTTKEWENSYIGGATIKNTTFPELLKMVKEDCEQFQKPRGHANDKIINWRWSSYNKEEEELEKKQREKEQKENLRQMRAESEMTDEEWNEFIKKIKAEQEKKGIFVDYSL